MSKVLMERDDMFIHSDNIWLTLVCDVQSGAFSMLKLVFHSANVLDKINMYLDQHEKCAANSAG